MPRRTKVSFGLPAFIADPNSLAYYGSGAQVDWAAVPDSFRPSAGAPKQLPAGKIVELTAAGKFIPHAGGANPALILQTDAREDSKTDALSGYGLFTGGNFYEALLPDAAGSPRVLTAGMKTALGARFFLQLYSDVR